MPLFLGVHRCLLGRKFSPANLWLRLVFGIYAPDIASVNRDSLAHFIFSEILVDAFVAHTGSPF